MLSIIKINCNTVLFYVTEKNKQYGQIKSAKNKKKTYNFTHRRRAWNWTGPLRPCGGFLQGGDAVPFGAHGGAAERGDAGEEWQLRGFQQIGQFAQTAHSAHAGASTERGGSVVDCLSKINFREIF